MSEVIVCMAEKSYFVCHTFQHLIQHGMVEESIPCKSLVPFVTFPWGCSLPSAAYHVWDAVAILTFTLIGLK